jgi:hypothetical protein
MPDAEGILGIENEQSSVEGELYNKRLTPYDTMKIEVLFYISDRNETNS